MKKFYLINAILIILFLLFINLNGSVHLTTLGFVVLGLIYVVFNLFIYFIVKFLELKERSIKNNS